MNNNSYHQTRLGYDSRREILWKTLYKYFFSSMIKEEDCVLDFGCGYGDFINNVKSKTRIAVDSWEEFPNYISPGIQTIVGNIVKLDYLNDESVDFAFASNVFEHLTKEDFGIFLNNLRPKLKENGILIILQPNYRYCYREYFDDYTHISIYSHISICDILKNYGYEIIKCKPKFLPFSIKSRFPVHPLLIWLYLKLPFKIMGKQMLIKARKA